MTKSKPAPKTKTTNYLITGGAGFLGYHLVKTLLQQNHKTIKPYNHITILDLAEQPSDSIYNQTTYIQGDVRDAKTVQKAIKNIDIIIHTAAALPLSSPKEIRTTTIDGTKNILEAALEPCEGSKPSQGSKYPRIIYVSSTAVYGVPEKHPILENDPLVGVGPYGHAKIAAEKLCENYRKKGLIVPIVRPKTFIGTERLGVFQILCNWVREGHKIPVIGNGQNRYQLLDVEDLVSAILLLATANSPRSQGGVIGGHHKKTSKNNSKSSKLKATSSVNSTFNVGAENFGTVNQDVGALCQHAGNGSTVFPVPSWLVKPILRILETFNLSPLYRWVYDTADKDSFVSVEKLKKLGWQPKYSNSQALIRMYDWYLKHYQQFETGPSGTTHRVGWNQGALGLIKRFL